MAIVFKCKCCANNIDVEEGARIVKCPACRTKQTVPSSRDENIQNLFNRATTLRLKCEFDKAEEVYERIIQADEEQYEAYWGLILCKFGVEYVEDRRTETRIPTCHRTSYESIVADENYKLALKYALDEDQIAIYKADAQEIDKIQKGILEVAQNEDPYDVFICYKETDADGKRTPDSVIANDIYHQLTQEGFKVFYAAITLEGKLGSAYEPIIFAALNSAKVMLAIGTKPEYFNAVWVKNEWSRFLKMNKDDRNKLLIPCYRDFDPYDLPDAFAHLQAQDMSKIGFITDLIRGVKKVMERSVEKPTTVVVNQVANVQIENILKRLKIAVEDGEWNDAKRFVEQILNIDAENSDAYLYSLLIRLELRNKGRLENCKTDFSTYSEYKRAYEYGNIEQRHFLYHTLAKVRERVRLEEEKDAQCKKIENEITQIENQINGIKSANESRNVSLNAAKNQQYSIMQAVKNAKIAAVWHLIGVVCLVISVILAIYSANAKETYDYYYYWDSLKNYNGPTLFSINLTGGISYALLMIGILIVIISLFCMTHYNPNGYTNAQKFGFMCLSLLFDIVGIVFMIKSFNSSADNIPTLKACGASIVRLGQEISESTKRIEALRKKVVELGAQLRQLKYNIKTTEI